MQLFCNKTLDISRNRKETLCEQKVTVAACYETFVEFPNKCPGSDGVSVDFYFFLGVKGGGAGGRGGGKSKHY